VSGFAGIIRLESSEDSAEQDRAAIDRMARTIAFRGPDSLQQTHQARAFFAFSFLKTGPAPQSESQPITLDGNTWLIGDVRCDGRHELIAKLVGHGVDLPAAASAEQLLLHCFAKFGAAGLPDLDGDFSFALWTPAERKLIAFRDLTGSRPFFYSHRDGVFIFSNTMQSLFSHPIVSTREYDLQFMRDFLLGAPHHDPERTVYRDIRRLPPGHLVEFSPKGFSVRRVANFPIEEIVRSSNEEIIEEFRRLLSQAVEERLPEGPTSILLSGGVDSTSIAVNIVSLRKRQSSSRSDSLRALCIDFQPLYDDQEGYFASRVANAFEIPLQLIHSGDVLPFADWENSASSLPEPLMDPYALLCLWYRKEASRHSRVVFSGDGGDELLRLQAAPYLRYLARHDGIAHAMKVYLQCMIAQRGFPPLGFGLRSGFFRLLGRKPAELMYPPWFAPDFAERHKFRDRWGEIRRPRHSEHPFHQKAYIVLNGTYLGGVLELSDAIWTGVPLETRNPFLDRRLCRFLLRIPTIPWAINKHLIRVSQAGVLPDEILVRPKTPLYNDALVLQVAYKKWSPVPSCAPHGLLREIVDWNKLLDSLEQASDTSLYVHLRPVALSLWLNAVEKANWIQ
jgi:asparagine synthase (glutamine-hydrolysing)